ncbi:MAG TPA: hypothetical protein VF705_07595 [Longimicrobium sp.]|jgi:hypothetical protein
MANGTPVENPGWDDIKGIFAPFTSQMMWRFNLGEYEDVAANAQIILLRILTIGDMPPPPFPPLTQAQVTTFQNWVNNNCPQTAGPPTASTASAPAASAAPATATVAATGPRAADEPNPPFGQGRFRFR